MTLIPEMPVEACARRSPPYTPVRVRKRHTCAPRCLSRARERESERARERARAGERERGRERECERARGRESERERERATEGTSVARARAAPRSCCHFVAGLTNVMNEANAESGGVVNLVWNAGTRHAPQCYCFAPGTRPLRGERWYQKSSSNAPEPGTHHSVTPARRIV